MKSEDVVMIGALGLLAYLVYQMMNKSSAAVPSGTVSVGPTTVTGTASASTYTPMQYDDPNAVW